LETIRRSYDAVAEEYAAHLSDELEGKPLDREWLERFAGRVRGTGNVCDLGCGPGHVAHYLRNAGADVFGIDLSPAMVAEARRRNPLIPFREGNMLALDLESDSLAGIVAFYAVVHLEPAEVLVALREMWRVLKPGGLLLLAFHAGGETVHRNEMWGKAVELNFRFFQSEFIRKSLRDAGYRIEETMEREPYPDVEYPSRRAYILASRGEDGSV